MISNPGGGVRKPPWIPGERHRRRSVNYSLLSEKNNMLGLFPKGTELSRKGSPKPCFVLSYLFILG